MSVGGVSLQSVAPSVPERQAAVRTSAQATHVESTASFTFVTDDGDRVTIDASVSRDTAAARYDASGQLVTGARLAESRSFSLEVEGELDAEELRDIRRALKFLRRAGRDGRFDEREARRLAARDLDSLASISASLTTTRSVVGFEATA